MMKQRILHFVRHFLILTAVLTAVSGTGLLFGQDTGIITAETTDAAELDPEQSIGAGLLGIIPGETTLDDLMNHPVFKSPVQKQEVKDSTILTYKVAEMPDMPSIQLLVRNSKVEKLLIQLDQPRNLADAQQSFADAVGDCRPFFTMDKQGYYRVIYPERGFVFVVEPEPGHPEMPSDRVIQIVAETVKPDFFTQRAQMDLQTSGSILPLTSIQKDAEMALSIKPQSAPAHYLRAFTAFTLEDYQTAQAQIVEAIRIKKGNPDYHLLMLNILDRTERPEEGLAYISKTGTLFSQMPIQQAEIQILQGNFLRQQETPDEDGAMQEHRSVVERLQPLMESTLDLERIQAKKLLIRAYLALSFDIAQKDWPQPGDKEKAFLWVDAAAGIADNLVQSEHLSSEVMLDICLAAVETGLYLPESTLADSYIDRIAAIGDQLAQDVTDPLYLQSIYWKCGRGLFYGYRIAESRGDEERMEKTAIEAFQFLEPFCDNMPRRVLAVLGPVDYDFAQLFAQQPDKSAEMRRCRERAIRMMEEAAEENDPFTNGENGIRLVNLGKAYWQEGGKSRGYELTKKGIEWLEQAVSANALTADELSVPLHNAASMAEQLQKSDEAARFTTRADEIPQ